MVAADQRFLRGRENLERRDRAQPAQYHHPVRRRPNLDALAREGQRWTDFYVAAPVCSPSRGALMTGQLPNRSGLYGRQLPVLHPNDSAGIPERELTMAEALKAQGYRTAIIGKWHLGDAPDTLPTRHGFDYWFGLPYSNDMDWVGHLTVDELLALAAQGKNEAVAQEATRRSSTGTCRCCAVAAAMTAIPMSWWNARRISTP
jgi:arylsulfatase A-like enzyme